MKRLLVAMVLPLVARWAGRQEVRILAEGRALSEEEMEDARRVGVGEPERIRLLEVDEVPLPFGGVVSRGARLLKMGVARPAGMSLRYGVFVRRGWGGERSLLAHEFVHTAQYEREGGVGNFLRRYLWECWEFGYSCAPLEEEAREGAQKVARPGGG